MNKRFKHIKRKDRNRGKPLFKGALVLFVSLIFHFPLTLSAQVLNNTGAVISISNVAVVEGDTIENTAGDIYNQGTINLSGNYKNFGTTSGDGSYNIGGDWRNTGTFNHGLSTVRFNGTGIQSIINSGSGDFFNLVIFNLGTFPPSRILLKDDIEVVNNLNMNAGIIQTDINKIYLSNSSSSSLIYTSGRIIGKFERGINSPDNYLFPLGSSTHYNPLTLDPNTTPTAGSVLSEFLAADPGNAGLPLTDFTDDTVEIYDAFPEGYWSLTANNGFVSTDFNMTLDGSGFTDIQEITRILKRDAPAGDWEVDGIHKDTINETVARRDSLKGGISNSGNHFGFGRARPYIKEQPVNDTVCEGDDASFFINVRGRKHITYQWQIFDSGDWEDLSDDGTYFGTESDELLISPTDIGMDGTQYRVIITDKPGNEKTSNVVTLIVQPRPVIVATPAMDTICNGDMTHIVLSSNLPGTGYTLEKVYEGSILGATSNLNGDTISQILTNPGADVDSVVYRVIPVGPGTLNCEGPSILVVIWVEPTITVSALDETICDNTATNIIVSSTNKTTNGMRYTWTVADNANVDGESDSGATGQAMGTSIVQTLDNTSDDAQLVQYTITPWTLDNDGNLKCSGVVYTVDVWVEPTISVGALDDTICNNTPTNIIVSSTNNTTNGMRYTWTVVDNPDVDGESDSDATGQAMGTAIIQTLDNTTPDAQLVQYTITPWTLDNDGNLKCNGVVYTVDVWVEPTISVSALDDTICDNTPTNILVSSTNNPTNGMRYTWTVVDNPDVDGESDSGATGQAMGTPIVQTLDNTTPDAQLVQYTITPWTLDNDGNLKCNGVVYKVDIWVEPTISVSALDDTICDNTSTNILVSSTNNTTNGMRYTWTVADNPDVDGESDSGATGQAMGTAIVQTLDNTSPDAQLVQYTITPWSLDNNGDLKCNGTPYTVDIWVEPTVEVIALNDTICDNTPTNILVSSTNNTTNGMRYTWTVVDNPDVDGESDSGATGQAMGTAIVQTLDNTSPDAQLVQYTITPWSLDNNGDLKCNGTPYTIDIWVEPTIEVIALNDTICDNTPTNTLVSSTNNTTNGMRYTWTVVDNPDIDGESDSGATGQAMGTSIVQTLDNTTPDAQLVQYTITPWTLDNDGNLKCNGVVYTVDVWVEPTISVSAVDDTICDNTQTNILVSSTNNPTNGMRFTWTVADNPDVDGESDSGAMGQAMGTPIIQTLDNTSPDAQLVQYTITPWTLDNNGNLKCNGTPYIVDIWVEPTIEVIALNDTICDNTPTNILVSSSNNTSNGMRYTWTVVDNPDVDGESDSGATGQAMGTPIIQTLDNTSDDAQLVQYAITPWTLDNDGNLKCNGVVYTVDIWVEPTISVSAIDDTICDYTPTNILVSSTNNTTSGMRYTWTVVDNPDVEGESDSGATGQAMGTPIVQTLDNTSPNAQLVQYTITPWTLDNDGNLKCNGVVYTVDVWVEPTISVSALDDTICDNTPTNILVSSTNNPTNGMRYTWTVADNPDVDGESDSGAMGQAMGTPIIQTLDNTSPDAQLVQYTITPWTLDNNGNLKCNGTPYIVDIWVEPTIEVIALNDTICDNTPTNILVSSTNNTTNGMRYTWTVVDNPDVDGESDSGATGQAMGTAIVQTLDNTTPDAQLVQYTITPWTLDNNGNLKCNGVVYKVDIWVEPTISVSALDDTICDNTPTNILVSSTNNTTNGMRYTWTVVDNPNIDGESDSGATGQSMGTPIVQTLDNTSSDAQLVQYTITPWTLDNNGDLKCNGTPYTVDIWVEPTIEVIALNDTICDNTPTNILVSSTNNPTNGMRYTWTVVDNPDVDGESDSGAAGQAMGTPIIQTLDNTSPDAQLLQYTITPWTLDNNGDLKCNGTPYIVDIWVEPTIEVIALDDTICDNTPTNILVSSTNNTTNGMSYTWTVVDNPNVDGESDSGATGQAMGTPIVQTLDNTTPDAQLVQYTITPWTLDNNGNLKCNGVVYTVDVWVEPTISVSALDDTICDNTPTNILVSSTNNTTNGMRYTWIVVDNPDVEGESDNGATGQAMGTPIVQTLDNTSPDAQLVQYTITPWTLDNNGDLKCNGTPYTVDIWVEPTIEVIALNDTICDNTPTNILVSSTNTTTNGMRYTWTVADNPNIVGESNSGATGQVMGTPIIQTLDNTSPDAQLVQYNITPWTLDNDGNLKCNGVVYTVDIWVEPTISVSALDDTICDNTPTNIFVNSMNNTTNGMRFTWTVVDNPNIDGEGDSGATGQAMGTSIIQTLDNTSPDAQLVQYTITPWTLDSNGNLKCNGVDYTVDIWVEPTVTVSASDDTICDNTATDILVSSTNNTTNGMRYTWTVIDNPNVEGESNSGVNGQLMGSSIVQILDNTSPDAQLVQYTITPWTLDINGDLKCNGTPYTVDIWVEPTPTLTISVPLAVTEEAIYCNGSSIQFTIDNEQNTTGQVKYNLVVNDLDGVITGERASANYLDNASFIETLSHAEDTIKRVNYRFIPYIESEGGVPGCLSIATDTIVSIDIVPVLSALEKDSVLYGGYNITCNGLSDGQIELIPLGGDLRHTYEIVWADEGGNPIQATQDMSFPITGQAAAVYSFTITDTIGCFYSDSTELREPDALAIDNYTIIKPQCYGDDPTGGIEVDLSGGVEINNYTWIFRQTGEEILPKAEDLVGVNSGGFKFTFKDYHQCRFDTTFFIDPADRLSADTIALSRFGNYNITCNGEADAFVEVIGLGGTGPGTYNYKWYDDPMGTSISNTSRLDDVAAGTYYFWIQDANGCILGRGDAADSLVAFEITQPEPVLFNWRDETYSGGWNIQCHDSLNGKITLDYTGGHFDTQTHIYQWTGPGIINGNPAQSDLGPGTYTLHVEDVNGWCGADTIFELLEHPEITFDSPDVDSYIGGLNVSCYDSTDGRIQLVNVAGGGTRAESGIYSFKWDIVSGKPGFVLDVDTLSYLENIPAGEYRYRIEDQIGCYEERTVSIVEPDSLYAEAMIPERNGFNISCYNGNDGKISLVPQGGTRSYEYSWSDIGSSTDTTIEDLQAGIYSVSISDVNGCLKSYQWILNQPDTIRINPNPSDFIECYGDTSSIHIAPSGDVGSYEYWWNGVSGDNSLNGVEAGKYEVLVKDANDCAVIDSIELKQRSKIIPEILVSSDFYGEDISCFGRSDAVIELTVAGGNELSYSSAWSTGSADNNKFILSGLPAGNYSVVVTDASGCEADAEVLVQEPPLLRITPYYEEPQCNGATDGNISLVVEGGTPMLSSPAYNYSLNGNDNLSSPEFDNLGEGVYWVAVTDANNCTDTIWDIELEAPGVLTPYYETTDAECPDESDGSLSLLAIDGGTNPITINGGISWDFYGLRPGIFIVSIVDDHNCSRIDTIEIGVLNESCLDIPNAFTPNGDGDNDVWRLDDDEDGSDMYLYPDAELTIVNRWGEIVYFSNNVVNEPWDGTYKGRDLPIDSYHYVLDLKNGDKPKTGNVTIIR